MKEEKKVRDRKYVMVQASAEEKEEFKATASARGFNAVSVWMKWLAKRDQRALRNQDKPRE